MAFPNEYPICLRQLVRRAKKSWLGKAASSCEKSGTVVRKRPSRSPAPKEPTSDEPIDAFSRIPPDHCTTDIQSQ